MYNLRFPLISLPDKKDAFNEQVFDVACLSYLAKEKNIRLLIGVQSWSTSICSPKTSLSITPKCRPIAFNFNKKLSKTSTILIFNSLIL